MVEVHKKMDEIGEWATEEVNEPHLWLIILLVAIIIIAVVLFALGL